MKLHTHAITFLVALATLGSVSAQDKQPEELPALDLTKEPTLFVVGYAHLDTQWRWTYPQTIREYIPNTLNDNFRLFEKYPTYVFNFSGSRRYQMMQEYYPDGYAKLKEYVKAGRWFPCGSSVDENDANVPSAESYVRHVLYGNRFFRRELGVASEEYMLPDCFGFPAALPSMLAHCGIRGFSTQKLTWNAAVPIPFKVGFWEGPDGRGVIAALDPGSYGGEVLDNLATNEGWSKRIAADGKISGVFADYHYYGTGDVGGAPTERSVAKLEESIKTKGPLKIVAGPADWLFKAITTGMRAKLPRYKGELQLTEHSAGSITSEAYMKRWNRKNELLADAAERASIAAWWLGARAYPAQRLEDAWTLVLGSQMHDILPGTSHPRAYDYAWNDELIAANVFGAVLEDAVGGVASVMSTQTANVPLVVFNPLSIEREDVVEAEIFGSATASKGVRVLDADGKPVRAQILGGSGEITRVAFLAKVPSVGFAVFDVQLVPDEVAAQGTLKVEEKRLENERYSVKLDDAGDIASIFDKTAKRELLKSPARLGLHYENPRNWPAWNQDWADREKPAREFVGGPARFRVVERGPARVALEVTRENAGSTFVQTIRLAAGSAGDRVEIDARIDWAARERSLRAAFPLTVSNPNATYDLQVGAIERPNSHKEHFEYASQQWFDLTDAKGDYGVSIMNDSKYGSDKPSDDTLRLTLLHTPGTRGGYQDQGTQDIGRHRVLYAIAGHAGDWRAGHSALQAARLNQPLYAFRASAHEGALGKSFSLLGAGAGDGDVLVSAMKKAEDSNEVVVRVRELSGREQKGVRIASAVPFASAREIDGQEREIAPTRVKDGAAVVDMNGFELRAFALKLGTQPAGAMPGKSTPVDLAFDVDVASRNDARSDGAMDARGASYPAEQLPPTLTVGDVTFKLGATTGGTKNALACRGQSIPLQSGQLDRVYLLAASSEGDVEAELTIGNQPISVHVGAWNGMQGQWDRRLWLGNVPEQTFGWSNELGGIEPGYVKPGKIAWYASHHHTPSGDAHYQYSYLYCIAIDVPRAPTPSALTLPKDERIKVLAISVVSSSNPRVVPAAPLFDTLDDHAQDAARVVPASGSFADATDVTIEPRLYWRPGSIRYTLDGSDPTASSTAYAGPFSLNRASTIKCAVFDASGRAGPIASAKLDVADVTPPTVTKLEPMFGSPTVRVEFSEPLDDSAATAGNYTLEPRIAVRSARKSADARAVLLELESAPEVNRAYRLKIAGVKDDSPAHNAMKSATLDLTVKGPVFEIAGVAKEQMGKEIRDVKGLPVKGRDAWTINMFVRAEKQPPNRTLIAGFGRCEQTEDGVARYLAKFSSGVRFWSHNRDVDGKAQLDLGRWQMITTTYDGKTLRLYKDAEKIGERDVELSDDENAVRIAPLDPWEKKRRFEGEIRDFTIWSGALGENALRSLKDAATER